MAVLLRFNTCLFDVSQERPNPINPIYGESLLRWLKDRWQSGAILSDPEPEDWGWYAYVSLGEGHYMLGASCSGIGEKDMEWVLQVVKRRSLGDRLLGQGEMSADDGCVREVRRLLDAEPGFHGVSVD
jgi:hypothetical protein